MSLISIASVNAVSLASSGLMNSPLMQQIIGDGMMHAFFSVVRKSRKSRFTRAQRRKMLNRRRRWFTDNIIMHHKRLHDKNRQIVVASARVRMLAKNAAKKDKLSASQDGRKWRDRVEIKDRGRIIRGRIDAKRSRARSRWLSVAEGR